MTTVRVTGSALDNRAQKQARNKKPETIGDRRKVAIAARRKRAALIVMKKNEWLDLRREFKPKVEIPEETQKQLLRVTNIYAASLQSQTPTVSVSTVRDEIRKWQAATVALRDTIWKESDRKARPITTKLSKPVTWQKALDKLLNKPVKAPSQEQILFPLAFFDQVLKRTVFISNLLDSTIDKATTKETELWFLWLALVIAHLKKGGVPVMNPKRPKELLTGAVRVLEKLQSKLPLQRRQGESFRKAAKTASEISPKFIHLMESLLAHWAKGNVATPPLDRPSILKLGFDEQFNKQFTRAMSPKAKRKSKP